MHRATPERALLRVRPSLSNCGENPGNLCDYTIRAPSDLRIPEAEHFEPPSLELPGSRFIVSPELVEMLLAVELDDQSRFEAAEIDDEVVKRNLSSKFPIVERSISENRPKMLLRVGGLATHPT